MTSAGLEGNAVVDAFIALLSADTAPGGVSALVGGRIYESDLPAGLSQQPYPVVTVSLLSAQSDTTADGTHVWQRVTVLTKVTTSGNDQRALRQIAARIFAVLNGLERYVYAPGQVYLHKVRHLEVAPQAPDFKNSTRYNYHNSVWFTEAEPAS